MLVNFCGMKIPYLGDYKKLSSEVDCDKRMHGVKLLPTGLLILEWR